MRLIDADELVKKFCGNCPGNDCKPDATDTVYGCEIMSVIDDQPTIEPKRGEWILIGKSKIAKSRDLKCSVCRNYFRVYDDVTLNAGRGDANFCPNCGAKMYQDGGTISKERYAEIVGGADNAESN